MGLEHVDRLDPHCRFGVAATAAGCHGGAHLLPTHGPRRGRHRLRRSVPLHRRPSGCTLAAAALFAGRLEADVPDRRGSGRDAPVGSCLRKPRRC